MPCTFPIISLQANDGVQARTMASSLGFAPRNAWDDVFFEGGFYA
jgi:hypothetical protein